MVGDGATDRIFLESQVLEEISGSADSYPLTDALRSVRLTTDDTGTASGVVDYDVWGNVRSGTSGQLSWTGELRDDTTGQVHLRARDYSPSTGRFTSRDTLVPNASGTNGYNPYWYANNNPGTLTDSTGLEAFCAICTPIAQGVLEPLVRIGAALAAEAAVEIRQPQRAQLWASRVLFLVELIFECILSPLCHQGVSVMVGKADKEFEEIKRHTSADESLQKAYEQLAGILFTYSPLFYLLSPDLPPADPNTDCDYIRPFAGGGVFRQNLACRTKINYPDGPRYYDAHHVFPKAEEFRPYFERALGIGGVHDPNHGQWWPSFTHRRSGSGYNARWRRYFSTNPIAGRAEVEQQGRTIMLEYGLTTLY